MEVESETQVKKRTYACAFNTETEVPIPENTNIPLSCCAKPKKHHGCGPIQRITMSKDDGCESDGDRRMLVWVLNYLVRNNPKYNDISDAKFIVEKTLTHSDVDKVHSRLAFTKKQIRTPFLTDSLELALQWKEEHKQNIKIDVKAILIVGSNSKEYQLAISRWNYHDKDNNNNNNKDDSNHQEKKKKRNKQGNNKKKKAGWKYVLKGQWNDLRRENNLQVGDVIRLVSFSSHNKLHIAILKV